MVFFLLFDTKQEQARYVRLSELAAVQGFVAAKRISLGSRELVLFGRQTNEELHYYQAGNGAFIAVLGSLLFDGDPAPACLERLLTRFDPDTFSWQGLLGTHIILIYKNGQLHVLSDGLGASMIYANADNSVCSNSFLAMLEITQAKAFDKQACYEYAVNGAVFGQRTLVEGIRTLPANAILAISGNGIRTHQQASPVENEAPDPPVTLDRVADYHCARLSKVFAPIAENFGDRIRLSFSGGFDSRLMLAMLMKHGANPTLFVYGDDDDEDVRIARTLCKAEGLTLECIDKSTAPVPDPEAFVGETEKNLFAFDGWKVETPLFDFGEDRRDRFKRHLDGQVPLNGSLGEIYRNFFYMPDRPSSTGAVISTFYSRYDPKAFTGIFDEESYRSAMAQSMRDAIGAQSDTLDRSQVEELYPHFRGRFWTGRDAQINQRFGPMFFPYLEHAAISNTAKIPIGLKDLGYLQGRMIGHVNSRLAEYPSDYGFALNGARPLKYRIKSFLGTQRPPNLRKISFRMTHRVQQPRSGALSDTYLSRVIDLEFPIMRTLFNLDAVNSSTQYGLIATLEYLGQRYNLRVSND